MQWGEVVERKISFDGVTYPALFLMGVNFTPAPPKESYINIAGSSGTFDATDVLSNGDTPYNDSVMTVSLAVPWTRTDDWTNKDGTGRSQEGRFFSNVHGKKCKVRLSDIDGLSLTGRVVVTNYNNASQVKRIDLSVHGEPFWMEDQPIRTSFVIDTDNQFTLDRLLTYSKSRNEISWEFNEDDPVPAVKVSDAIPGDYLDIKVSGLDARKTYSFSMNVPTNLSAKYRLYAVSGGSIEDVDASNITGISEFIVRFQFDKAAYAYAFSHPTLTIASAGSVALSNLDKPAEINYYADRNCTVIVGDERHDIKMGAGTIYGATLPPNTDTVVSVVGNENGFCELSYMRGVLICTL